MSEEGEAQGSGAAAGSSGIDATRLALGGASREVADALLEKQGLLLDLQIADNREQRALHLSHLRIRRFSDYAKMTLEIAVGLFLLVIVGGFGVMVWNAARDHDLIIDAFIVPPDMAARGLTGEVVAAELLNGFAQMQIATASMCQAAASSRNAAVDNIKIAIPQTGVSIGELDRYLRGWLGHETHVGGAVVHTPTGLSISVRYGSKPSAEVEGADADFKNLMQRASESLYTLVLPSRYADYLSGQQRGDEALAVLRPLSRIGMPSDRACAITSWAELILNQGQPVAALNLAQQAFRLAPETYYTRWGLADSYFNLGHDQAEFEQDAQVVHYAHELEASADPYLRYVWLYYQGMKDWRTGDHQATIADWDRFVANGGFGNELDGYVMWLRVYSLVGGHDLAAARQAVADIPSNAWYFQNNFLGLVGQEAVSSYSGDWRSVVSLGDQASAVARGHQPWIPTLLNWARPHQAIALAHLGDNTGAEALIATTALDCDLCVRARGQITALRHDWRAAEHWFALVAARSPSIPYAATDWGAALRMKGDLDGAIAKFSQANVISPHFADPLEMWGEALIAKNRSDLALAKLADAGKYAPNWGRLHLKWGEALFWLGRRDEARAQFAVASRLELSVVERAELAQVLHG